MYYDKSKLYQYEKEFEPRLHDQSVTAVTDWCLHGSVDASKHSRDQRISVA